MVVILHVIIALVSIGAATITFFRPSRQHFIASYFLASGTLVSGVYLAFIDPARMLHVCISGSLYLAFVSVAVVVAHSRFKKLQESKN